MLYAVLHKTLFELIISQLVVTSQREHIDTNASLFSSVSKVKKTFLDDFLSFSLILPKKSLNKDFFSLISFSQLLILPIFTQQWSKSPKITTLN